MNHDNGGGGGGGWGYAVSLVNHDNGGGGGGRVYSNNPDHKVGMIAQRILKVSSLISLGALEQ